MRHRLPKKIFVTGIDTDIGKTVVSAIMTKALMASYWKPVQCGDLENSDTSKVARWTGQKVFPESYRLLTPESPHLAAFREGVTISLNQIKAPEVGQEPLVVEGAGGLLVPLNDQDLIIDVVQRLDLPTILVTKNYLGCLNHTLLSIEALQRRGIPICGLVFNGKHDPELESYLIEKAGAPKLFHLEVEENINSDVINKYAKKLTSSLISQERELS
jgi:dethiobiotin synthetase